jgi:hypothetical protein
VVLPIFLDGLLLGSMSPGQLGSNQLNSDRKTSDYLVVLLLGLADGQTRVDLQRFPPGVPGVRLDEGIVDSLFLEPGEEEVAQLVGGHRSDHAGGGRVAGQDGPHTTIAVGLLPGGLEQVLCPFLASGFGMEGEGLRSPAARPPPPPPHQ